MSAVCFCHAAIATGRAKVDVARDLRRRDHVPKPKHFAAIRGRRKWVSSFARHRRLPWIRDHRARCQTTPHRLRAPWELRRAEWSEFDLERAVWSIPAEKMKMRWPHQVPLSRQVLDLLDEIRPLTGHSPYVFPASRTWKRPMSENTVTFALRRTGLQRQRDDRARLPGDGGDAAQRDGTMEPRRDRTAARPHRRTTAFDAPMRAASIGRSASHDAALVRLSRPASPG